MTPARISLCFTRGVRFTLAHNLFHFRLGEKRIRIHSGRGNDCAAAVISQNTPRDRAMKFRNVSMNAQTLQIWYIFPHEDQGRLRWREDCVNGGTSNRSLFLRQVKRVTGPSRLFRPKRFGKITHDSPRKGHGDVRLSRKALKSCDSFRS